MGNLNVDKNNITTFWLLRVNQSQKHEADLWYDTNSKSYCLGKKYTSGPRYWNVPVLVNTGTFLVYQYCLKMWYLRPLERAGVIQKLTILERKNGLVLANTCVPVSGTWSILFPCLVNYLEKKKLLFNIKRKIWRKTKTVVIWTTGRAARFLFHQGLFGCLLRIIDHSNSNDHG